MVTVGYFAVKLTQGNVCVFSHLSSLQCSATELWQLDNHQLSESSVCTALKILCSASNDTYWVAVRLSGCRSSSGRPLATQARCPGFNCQQLPAFSLSSISPQNIKKPLYISAQIHNLKPQSPIPASFSFALQCLSIKKDRWGFVYLPSLLYHHYLVSILSGMPSL